MQASRMERTSSSKLDDSLPDELDFSCAKIDGFDLFDHHEPGQVRVKS